MLPTHTQLLPDHSQGKVDGKITCRIASGIKDILIAMPCEECVCLVDEVEDAVSKGLLTEGGPATRTHI